MNLDSEYGRILVTKQELYIMRSALVEFWQEKHWQLDASNNKSFFKEKFNENFSFFLYELNYVMQELWELRWNFRDINIEKISIFLFQEMIPPKKPMVIYAALNECSKNYEDYEISIRTGITKQELDQVLKEFKEKVIDKIIKGDNK